MQREFDCLSMKNNCQLKKTCEAETHKEKQKFRLRNETITSETIIVMLT